MYDQHLLALAHLHRQELTEELAHDRAWLAARTRHREPRAARLTLRRLLGFEGRKRAWPQAFQS